ncbi:hypothetical protein L207DRAFT_200439 [Hyaloscypha variabilis F]|uniref:Uncharacterized protein n=1 Tax=Hyaloscypha variabilis (strain UAMH 11265 / GT02V1 / F) TaxID=1149755 RepID=A0A2J6QX05_HYAVF|nr:hypothetical protein L207DRAFT_200439 [Hyaloscypha variabilis F]
MYIVTPTYHRPLIEQRTPTALAVLYLSLRIFLLCLGLGHWPDSILTLEVSTEDYRPKERLQERSYLRGNEHKP